eukprot:GHVS01105005.1.p1 GENE.GHVS01105005.1~~GHVS01105005.1.p1  ORF type:complete len:203 (-),score=17.43 GHVS01105005.1:306-914(-)
MRLLSVTVGRITSDQQLVILVSAFCLSKLSFFERKVAREACTFLARTAAPRVALSTRETVVHEDSVAFIYRWPDSLCVVAVADEEYPSRLAYKLIDELARNFRASVPRWREGREDGGIQYKPQIKQLLETYKEPSEFDKLVQTQQKTEAVHEHMRHNISTMLQTGENLDKLVSMSNDLSETSKQMFKSSRNLKKRYSCCKVQ